MILYLFIGIMGTSWKSCRWNRYVHPFFLMSLLFKAKSSYLLVPEVFCTVCYNHPNHFGDRKQCSSASTTFTYVFWFLNLRRERKHMHLFANYLHVSWKKQCLSLIFFWLIVTACLSFGPVGRLLHLKSSFWKLKVGMRKLYQSQKSMWRFYKEIHLSGGNITIFL